MQIKKLSFLLKFNTLLVKIHSTINDDSFTFEFEQKKTNEVSRCAKMEKYSPYKRKAQQQNFHNNKNL